MTRFAVSLVVVIWGCSSGDDDSGGGPGSGGGSGIGASAGTGGSGGSGGPGGPALDASSLDGSTDATASNPDATASNPPKCDGGKCADLVLEISDSPDPASVLGLLEYTVTVTNLGPASAYAATVALKLAPEMNLVMTNPSCGGSQTMGCALVNPSPTIMPGETRELNVGVTVSQPGTYTVTTSVYAVELDPAPSDNNGEESTTVTGS